MAPEDPLERALRAALRPVDPGAGFAPATLRRLGTAASMRRRLRTGAGFAALAASLLLAFTLGSHVERQRERARAQYAREQLQIALEVTGSELRAVQRRLDPHLPQEDGT